MDLSNLVYVQIKFKLLQVDIFAYIHFQCQWAISMEAYFTKMWYGKFMDAIHMVQNVY